MLKTSGLYKVLSSTLKPLSKHFYVQRMFLPSPFGYFYRWYFNGQCPDSKPLLRRKTGIFPNGCENQSTVSSTNRITSAIALCWTLLMIHNLFISSSSLWSSANPSVFSSQTSSQFGKWVTKTWDELKGCLFSFDNSHVVPNQAFSQSLSYSQPTRTVPNTEPLKRKAVYHHLEHDIPRSLD